MSPVAELAELSPCIPERYQRAEQPSSSMSVGNDVPNPYLLASEMIVPLWELSIGDNLVRPAVPIGVRIRREGKYFFAENEALSIYAHGDSPEGAVEDFKSMAAFFAEEYRSLAEDSVVGLGARLRETFQRVFPA